MDFRGFDSSRILVSRGGILKSVGIFPGNVESTNLGRDDLSREIWQHTNKQLGNNKERKTRTMKIKNMFDKKTLAYTSRKH